MATAMKEEIKMYSENYTRATEAIADSKDWTLYTLLQNIKPVEQIKKIKEVFLAACKREDDKSALRYFQWLLKAVDDSKLIPFLKKERNHEVLPRTEEVEKAKTDARIVREKIARQLYNKLQSSAKGTARHYYTENESELIDIDIPVLLKTKQAILTEIAEWWRETQDEKESDAILVFLNDVPTEFDEEVKIKLGVVRKVTGFGFPVARLTRQLLLLQPGELSREDDIAPILAIARARNRRLNIAVLEMRVVQHMEGCSEASFQLLEDIAKQVSNFDVEVRELEKKLKTPYEIYGEIQFSYFNVNAVRVLIEQEHRPIPPEDILHEQFQQESHKQFEKARDKIINWKKKYPNRKVELSLIVKSEYDSQKSLFIRKQTI